MRYRQGSDQVAKIERISLYVDTGSDQPLCLICMIFLIFLRYVKKLRIPLSCSPSRQTILGEGFSFLGETRKVEDSLMHCIKNQVLSFLNPDSNATQATILIFSDQETYSHAFTCWGITLHSKTATTELKKGKRESGLEIGSKDRLMNEAKNSPYAVNAENLNVSRDF